MTTTSSGWSAQVVDHTRRLQEYKETLSRLFPALQRHLVDARSISDADAIVLALFLRCYPHELGVLEVGAFLGVSTFHLASQPSVVRVLSVDPDLPEDRDREPLQGTKATDMARAALAEFDDVSAKIQFRAGDVSSAWTNHSPGSPADTQLPVPELSEDEPLLAFVNGGHTRGAVDANLQAIFNANPHAMAILDHCRGIRGPFVQAGIASFMERAQGKYHFRLFGDLNSGLATSNLGIVYPDADCAEVQECLAELGHLFSERLDPLWLASREQELIGIVKIYKDEAENLNSQHQDLIDENQLLAGRNTELEKRTSELEKRKTQLEERTAGLRAEKKDLQKRTSQLEKRVSQLEKRKSQMEERNTALKEENKTLHGRVSQLEKRNSRLEERNSRLAEERVLLDSQLSDYRASGRYKLADAVTKSVLRIPGAKALARRTRPKE
jgi:hypothetical protein